MGNYRVIFLGLFLFLIACGKKPDRIDILKQGENLYNKYGCGVCHSLEGKEIYGPPLNEIYNKQIRVMREGREFTIVADREYLIRAINDPRSEKVSGYQNKDMPIPVFSKEETEILVDYIIEINRKKSVKSN